MAPKSTPHGGGDTLATTLRHLAQRAHRVLRQGHAEDRDEIYALLDEIARSRGLFEGVEGGELRHWLDRLEAQLTEAFAPIEALNPHPEAKPPACGVGAA